MLAIVAMERLVDEGILVSSAEYLADHLVATPGVGGAEAVVLPALVLAGMQLPEERGIRGEIDLATLHFLIFCHLCSSACSCANRNLSIEALSAHTL